MTARPASFVPGRRFRVVKEGATLVHGDWGASAGRVVLSVGTIITFRGWLSNDDGDSSAIWHLPEGVPPELIHGALSPHEGPWAVVTPARKLSPETSPTTGWSLDWPDPDYLQPVDADGEPAGW